MQKSLGTLSSAILLFAAILCAPLSTVPFHSLAEAKNSSQSSSNRTRSFHAPSRPAATFGGYANPLPITLPDGSNMESCPDPSIIHSKTPGDDAWYMYCTNEIFHPGSPMHLMPISRSTDLAHWTYVGDVFRTMPSFLPSNTGLWAPDIQFFNGKYYLYYSSSLSPNGPAIYVATSDRPEGPFTPVPTPVIAQEQLPDGLWRDYIDSNIATEGSQRYIIYGSFRGGIAVRLLTEDGFSAVPSSEVQISPSYRYEGSYIVQHDGYYYLFVSAGTCCAGSGSGYGVFVARASHVLGPYIDKDGVSLMDRNVGGTPVIVMNGNHWLGPGHNATFTDPSGQDWMIYHAVDAAQPTFPDAWTRRPAMIDPIQWNDGWPTVRAGAGASDELEPAPARAANAPQLNATSPAQESMGAPMPAYSADFHSTGALTHWRWIHGSPSAPTSIQNGALVFPTQAGDMREDQHNAPLLAEPAPSGDYVVEVKLSNNLPSSGQHNYVAGGFVIYQDDDHYLKLTLQSIADTMQLEFARKDGPGTWGRAYLASASPETWLRIARHGSVYTSYSSHDGLQWTRGPSWALNTTHPRIALISAGGSGFVNRFEYVRVGERQ